MKRLKTLLYCLTILLIAGLVTAQVELTIAHGRTGGADRLAFDQIIAAFEAANPDITVRQIVQDDDLYQDTGLITLLQSSSPPDIYFQFGGEQVASNARNGFAADLTDALSEDGWRDSFIEAAWSAPAGTVYEGRIYMVPSNLDVTTVIWYNEDVFAEYDLTEPATWEEFLTVVETLASNGETPLMFGNQELWPFGNWAGHVTARVVSPETFDAAFRLQEPFNQAEFVDAFQLFETLHELDAFNLDMPSLGADPAMSGFFQGFAVMHPIGSWLVPLALESAPEEFNYSAFNTPIIAGGNGSPNSIIGLSTGHMITADTPHFDEAVRFLKFFSNVDNQITWAEAGAFSAVRDVMDNADLNPNTQKLAQLFAEADAIVPPPDTGYPVEVADVFYQGAAFVAAGQRSAEDALVWIDEQLEPLR
ncbi:MAG: extracellular solute-binding protein [Deinococcota bacterium]